MMRQATLLSVVSTVFGCGYPTRSGYECSYTIGEMTVHWGASFDGQFVEYIAEMPQEYGWMALGFNDVPYMQGTTAVVSTQEQMAAYNLIDRDSNLISSTQSSPDWLNDMDTFTENGMKIMAFRRYLEFPVTQLPDEWLVVAYSATDSKLSQHSPTTKSAFLATYGSTLESKMNAFSQHDDDIASEVAAEDLMPSRASVSYVVSEVSKRSFLSAVESFKAEVSIELQPGSEIKCIQVCKVTRKSSDSDWEDGECFGCDSLGSSNDEVLNTNMGYKLLADGTFVQLDDNVVTEAGWKSAASVGGVYEDTTITVEINYRRSNYRTVVGVSLVLISCILYLTFFATDADFEDDDDSDSDAESATPLKTVVTDDSKYFSDCSLDNFDEKTPCLP